VLLTTGLAFVLMILISILEIATNRMALRNRDASGEN